MKALIKTSVSLLVVAFGLAIFAGAALAAPADKVIGIDDLTIEHPNIAEMVDVSVIPAEQEDGTDEGVFPDGGGDECVGCDDDGDDDGSDDGNDEPQDDGDQPLDDGGDDGVVDEEETPPVDEGDDEGKTDEEETPPVTDDSSGKKLPNTGTQLAIIGGIGLLAALIAFASRRALKKRMR